MGIPGLWDVIGEGEVRHIAEYASAHFEQYRRPLRIAVDEATWRFTNLTDEQVARIREGEPAANPIEKTILWRILRLWRLNIQLLFVWDGMKKPNKGRTKGRGGGKVDDAVIKLLHKMFDLLQIPYHRAPGEAEAECARLQQLGIVDAVWSDDGDSFMFGATTLIKQHKVSGAAVKDHIRIYRATDLHSLDLDADSLVLFALLSGGDYDRQGIRGCGPTTAKRVCKRNFGLSKALANVMSERDLPALRESIVHALRGLEVPVGFPKWKIFEAYRNPAISTDEKCYNLRGLRGGWARPMDEAKVRNFLRDVHHFETREYLKHIAPTFLVRKLVNATTPELKQQNLDYQVQMKRTRKTKAVDGEDPPAKCEAKILYAPAFLVGIDLTVKPENENWEKLAAKDGTPWDPLDRVECEIPLVFLSHGLPEGSYETPPSPKRRKKKADLDPESSSQGEQANANKTSAAVGQSSQTGPVSTDNGNANAKGPHFSKRKAKAPVDDNEPKKRKKPSKETPAGVEPVKKKQRKSKKLADQQLEPSSPPRSQFRVPDLSDFHAAIASASASASTPGKRAKVIDLGDESEDEDQSGLFVSPMSNPAPFTSSTSHRQLPRQLPRTDADHALSPTPLIAKPTITAPPSTAPVAMERHGRYDSLRAENLPSSAPAVSITRTPSRTAQQTPDAASRPHPRPFQTSPLADLVPGETINAATLRELRLAAMLNLAPSTSSTADVAIPLEPPPRPPPPARVPEIIDLT